MVTVQVSDFDMRKIATSGQCFRMTEWIARPGHPAYFEVNAIGKLLQVRQEGDRVHFFCSDDEYETVWRNYFDLGTNYTQIIQAIKRKYSDDQFLMNAIEYGRGIRILRHDFFETLISFIISQRKNIPEIRKCVNFLSSKFAAGEHPLSTQGIGNGLSTGSKFPSAKQLAASEISEIIGCGVGYRAKYIHEAAKWYSEFPGNWESELSGMGYERAMETLMKIYGVGPKVANCVCLFSLHYMNACPVDVWIQKVLDQEYFGNIPQWFSDPYAGLIQQFVFFYKRNGMSTLFWA